MHRCIVVLACLFGTVLSAAGEVETPGQYLPKAQACTNSITNAAKTKQWLADLFRSRMAFAGFYVADERSPKAAFFGPSNVTGWVELYGGCPTNDFSAVLRNDARIECNGEASTKQSTSTSAIWTPRGGCRKLRLSLVKIPQLLPRSSIFVYFHCLRIGSGLEMAVTMLSSAPRPS